MQQVKAGDQSPPQKERAIRLIQMSYIQMASNLPDDFLQRWEKDIYPYAIRHAFLR